MGQTLKHENVRKGRFKGIVASIFYNRLLKFHLSLKSVLIDVGILDLSASRIIINHAPLLTIPTKATQVSTNFGYTYKSGTYLGKWRPECNKFKVQFVCFLLTQVLFLDLAVSHIVINQPYLQQQMVSTGFGYTYKYKWRLEV